MAETILLNAHELSHSFSGRTLFKGVSFGVNRGEKIGLVGPNGAGKSTLLKILTNQLVPDSGILTSQKGLKIAHLEQTPVFKAGDTLLDAILSRCEDREDFYGMAYSLLSDLGLEVFGEDFLVENLSGGWQKRLALGRELVCSPDLLILDEPTNHLDIGGILWLENYLRESSQALMMVTHDRLFLQRVVNRILDLDPRNPNFLLKVQGDYSQYLQGKSNELMALERQEKTQKNTLRRELEWLGRGAIARVTKQTARIKSTEQLQSDVEDLARKNRVSQVGLSFGTTDHSPKKLMEIKGLTKSYGDLCLFKDLDLLITPKTRLGLLGENGSGKSTLIRTLLGDEEPDSGSIKRAEKLQVSYFEQGRETLDFEKSVLQNVCPDGDFVDFQGNFIHVRSYLDRFLFSGEKPELPVGRLSGGEQARLRLAQVMLKSCQVLILDEPTNDLDVETLGVLESALEQFQGAVILVSHDRYFLDSVSNQILAFQTQGEGDSGPLLQTFSSYFQWENWFTQESQEKRSRKGSKSTQLKDIGPKKTDSEQNSIGKEREGSEVNSKELPLERELDVIQTSPRRKLSNKERYELEKMEQVILDIELKLEELKTEWEILNRGENSKNLSQLNIKIAETQVLIDEKYERWAELESLSKSSK